MGKENLDENLKDEDLTNSEDEKKEEPKENLEKEETSEEAESKVEDEETSEEEELKEQLIRLQADFMNYKKRVDKEKQGLIKFAIKDFVSDLLPIIDNFERALNSEEDKENGFYNGVELIYQDLMKLLKSHGVEEIKEVGEDFDPNLHHAVIMEESDEYEEGKVIEVLQTGYKIEDKLVRPAMVKVSE